MTALRPSCTLRHLGLPPDRFRGVGPAVLAKDRQRAAAAWPRELRARAAPMRATLLAAFCAVREREIVDGLVEVLLLPARHRRRPGRVRAGHRALPGLTPRFLCGW